MSRSSILLFCCASVLSAGCVDPGGKFKDFERRLGTTHGDGGGADAATCTVSPGSVQGQYLLAISVSIARTKPIVALTDLTTPPAGSGAGLSMTAQPLSAADRLTPVGPSFPLGPFPIDQSGGFRADIPGLQVSGQANPVTGGDITADVSLVGNLCGDGRFFCGIITGTVQKPLALDLAGSTFTLTRVDPGTSPPTRPAIDCSGALADPL